MDLLEITTGIIARANEIVALAGAAISPTEIEHPAWVDMRLQMPHNAAPDDPWLAARGRTDWWERPPEAIRRITLHHIGSNATAQQVAAYITRPRAQGGKGLPRTQYHYHIMPDGEILHLLDLRYGCWHDSGGDQNTGISIGMHGALHTHQPPGAQLVAAARLVAWLMGEYQIGLDAVNGHDEWARQFTGVGTACPGWTPAGWRADFFGALGEAVGARLGAAVSFGTLSLPALDFTEMDALERE